MNRNIKGMFTEETYIDLMNRAIRDNENYSEGMLVKHIGTGISLTKDDEDITTEEPLMLSEAHDIVVKQANERFEELKMKLKNQSQ